MKNLSKLIVILGTTATGKTKLALELCRKFNGEVISADSRQVYKYMTIGTDVPQGEWGRRKEEGEDKDKIFLVKNIPHHLMNCVEPDEEFSLVDFKSRAETIIKDIIKRGKVPFVVGGTGMYISALVDNWFIPKVMPNKILRKELESKSLDELVSILKQKDPVSARVVDLKNPRRVLRAVEVVLESGQSFIKQKTKGKPIFDVLQIGLQRERKEIYNRINQRIDQMIADGLIDEIKGLLDRGYSWNLPSMSSLGYRQFKNYLTGKQSLAETIEIFKRDTRHYAKRQLTWFKKDKRINWISPKDNEQVKKLIEDFLFNGPVAK